MGLPHLRNAAAAIGLVLVAEIVAVVLMIALGLYNVAADSSHTVLGNWLIQTARERSVAARAASIVPPADLRDPKRVLAGAGLYNEMCSGCHIGPGLERSEISHGLNPPAPEFARGFDLPPAQAFWIIKHGIKMTGMAAWGPTHSDTLIWDMVAFLQKMPALSAAQYQTMVKSAPAHDETTKGDMAGMKTGH